MPSPAKESTTPPAKARHSSGKKLPSRIAAANAKANLLRMLATVGEAGEYVITKRGKPVARLVPFELAAKPDIYGCMRKYGDVILHGNILAPLPQEEWGSLY